MKQDQPVADRSVARFHYTLTNDQGEVLDASRDEAGDGEPLSYLHGAGNIVPGLEKQMVGKKAGDKFKVRVTPEEGYGPKIPQMVQQMPRSAFPAGMELEPGMQFQAESQMGPVMITITDVTPDTVTADGNHPLAGEHLNFDVEVVDVRDPTLEELQHGHVHGPGGHHH